jgi:hypothetical protein
MADAVLFATEKGIAHKSLGVARILRGLQTHSSFDPLQHPAALTLLSSADKLIVHSSYGAPVSRLVLQSLMKTNGNDSRYFARWQR